MKKAYAVLLSVVSAVLLVLGLFAFPVRGSRMELTVDGYGPVVILLDEENAAMTVSHVRRLVRRGHYDGAAIYGISRGYFVSVGHGTNEKEIDPVRGEFEANGYENGHQMKTGTVYLLRYSKDYNSARSSFGICLSDDYGTAMNGLYAAFGTVVEGMDIIEEVSLYRVDDNGRPVDGDIAISEVILQDAAFFSTTSLVVLAFGLAVGGCAAWLWVLAAKEPKKTKSPAHKKK